jgi:hypothetical protein
MEFLLIEWLNSTPTMYIVRPSLGSAPINRLAGLLPWNWRSTNDSVMMKGT